MRRFFLPPGSVQGRRLVFTGREARHITRVLRLPRGEKIVGFDGSGREYEAVIAVLSPRRVEAIVGEVKEKDIVRPSHVALAQGLIKGGAFDRVVRQAAEIGVDEIFPLRSRRSVVRPGGLTEKKRQRWESIAVDAARQSGRARVPRVHCPAGWGELFNLATDYELKLLLWEKENRRTLKAVLDEYASPPAGALLVVGPEGGFTDEEAAEAAAAGFATAALFPTILRSSTAPLAALACYYYHYQGARPLKPKEEVRDED